MIHIIILGVSVILLLGCLALAKRKLQTLREDIERLWKKAADDMSERDEKIKALERELNLLHNRLRSSKKMIPEIDITKL